MSAGSNGNGSKNGAADNPDRGIRCPNPKCRSKELHVYSVRSIEGGKRLRVRYCIYCGRKITTHEKVVG